MIFCFLVPYDKHQTAELKLTNNTQDVIQFKVMATIPRYYRVKNKQGALKPGESANAIVRLEPLKDAKTAQRQNHRIVVQTARSDSTEVDKNFWREVDGIKHRVQFMRVPVVSVRFSIKWGGGLSLWLT